MPPISSVIWWLCIYVNKEASMRKSIFEKTKITRVSKIGTKSFMVSKEINDPHFFNLISTEAAEVSNEAFNDYELVIKAIENKKNFIMTENVQMSLEGYLDHIKDKYKDFHISLEEENPPVKDDYNHNKDEGFFAKVKSVIKQILEFFYNLFVSIKNKFLSLFDIHANNSSKQTEAIKNDFPEKIIETNNRIKNIKSSIKANVSIDDPIIEKYFKTGNISIKYNHRSFNIGRLATEKEFSVAIKDFNLSIDVATKFLTYNNNTASLLFSSFTSIVETGQINPEITYSKIITASVAKLRSIVDSTHFSSKSKDGSSIVGKLGGTYISMLNDASETLPRISARVIMPSKEDHILEYNRESTIVFIRDYNKFSKEVDNLVKLNKDTISSVEKYLRDIKSVISKNEENMQDAEILKEFRSIEKYLNDILTRNGTIIKFIISGKDFIFSTIESMVKEDASLSKKLEKVISANKEEK